MRFFDKVKKDLLGTNWALYFGLIALSIVLFVLDIVTKNVAYSNLFYGANPVTAVPNIFDFVLVFNNGAAWNWLADQKWLLTSISLLVGLGLIYVYLFLNKKLPTFAKVALSLMIAGCFGNLVDRIGYWGQFGIYKKGVIDFIHFSFWDTFPVFNLADSYLVVGIAVLAVGYIISSIVGKKEANEMSKKDTSDVSDADLLNKVRKNDSLTKKDGSEHDGKTNV